MKRQTEKLVLQGIKEYEKENKRIVTEEMKNIYTVYFNIHWMIKLSAIIDIGLVSFLKTEYFYIEVEAKKVKI